MMKKTKALKIKQLTADAMLAAMCAVLGAVSIDLGNLKVTLESLPILLGALLFGAADGAMIGFAGTFLYQVLCYGFTVTTFLWVLPYALCGLMVGFYAKKKHFQFSTGKTVLLMLAVHLIVTTLNTAVMYIDSKIFGYYSYVYIFGSAVVRYLISISKALVFGMLLPPLVKALRERLKIDTRTIAEEKKALRREVRASELAMPPEEKRRTDAAITEKLLVMPEYKNAKTVFCYVSKDNETDTHTILAETLADGKCLCVPLCTEKGTMELKVIPSLSVLSAGSYGILEPPTELPSLHAEAVDFAVVPCISCSHDGKRLGRGGGYYDRFLENFSGTAVMLCREALIRENIPQDTHDRVIPVVITEKSIYRMKKTE